jgi:hypothetical protein
MQGNAKLLILVNPAHLKKAKQWGEMSFFGALCNMQHATEHSFATNKLAVVQHKATSITTVTKCIEELVATIG